MDVLTNMISTEIKRQYKSVRRFSQAVNIPQTTLASTLKNGVSGTAYETVVKICKALDIQLVNYRFPLHVDDNALKMLDIYLENIAIWTMEEDINADKSLPYYERHKYKCIPYVNLRNKHRFKFFGLDTNNYNKIVYNDNMYDIEPHELYRQKAIRLYHKIVARYSNTWWD